MAAGREHGLGEGPRGRLKQVGPWESHEEAGVSSMWDWDQPDENSVPRAAGPGQPTEGPGLALGATAATMAPPHLGGRGQE